MMDTISIILPVYNNENTLDKCIKSILQQTYKNIELIIIDDGSIDKSIKIVEAFKNNDNRIKYIKNGINKGVSYSRNRAIEIATGKYTTFIDADDWLEENAIEQMYRIITEKNVDAVRTSFYRYYKDKKKAIQYNENYDNKILKDGEKDIFEKDIINNKLGAYLWLLIIKTSIIKDIKFNEDLGMMEDTVWYLKMLKEIDTIYFTNIATYNYYYNLQSASRSFEKAKRNIKNILLIKNIYDNDIFKDKPVLKIEYNTTLLKIIQENIYKLCLDSQKYKFKIQYLKELCYDNTFEKIINECNTKLMKIDKRIITKLLKNKKYRTIFFFCSIKKYIKR